MNRPDKNDGILIAVSACLLGQAVRYDGKMKPDGFVLGELVKSAELIPVCPEVAIGLGVPRPPVELVDFGNVVRVLGVSDRNLDVTQALTEYAVEFLRKHPDLSGMVLKSRSPSCGVGDTPIFTLDGAEIDLSSGRFAATVMEKRPNLPIIGETELELNVSEFLHNCRNYARLE